MENVLLYSVGVFTFVNLINLYFEALNLEYTRTHVIPFFLIITAPPLHSAALRQSIILFIYSILYLTLV